MHALDTRVASLFAVTLTTLSSRLEITRIFWRSVSGMGTRVPALPKKRVADLSLPRATRS